jgi:hypothetical protein
VTLLRAAGLGACLALGAPAWGAIAGIPESPRPGMVPGAWIGWSNDSFGGEMGKDTDDFRTNAFNAGLRLAERWVVAVDDSMLTDAQVAKAQRSRSDEVTATVGWMALPGTDLGDWGQVWATIGVGGRASGNLGGEALQNRWHDLLGYERIELPYARRAYDGVGYLAASWLWLEREGAGFGTPFLDRGHLGVALDAAGLASTGGETQVSLGVKLVALGRDGSFQLGVRQQLNAGPQASAAAAAVAAHEDGTWLVYGSSAGGWYFEGGVNLATQASIGRIGWMWERGANRARDPDITALEGVIGLYQGYSLGLQCRWQPEWVRDTVGPLVSLLFDYRFGQYAGPEWNDDMVVVRQPLLGVDVAWSEPRDGLQATPFAYLGAGLREERIRSSGPNPRFEQQRAVRGVVQGGVGVRLYWGQLPRGDVTARYGVSLVYDRWQPFSGATAVNGADHDQYQRPGGGFGMRLAAMVAW